MPIDEVLARLSHPGHGRPSRFHKRLLWITGFTQLGDAQALLVMMFLETQIPCAFPHVTVADVNALTTAVFLGMLLGALAGGGIADTYGRRVTYLLMTLAVGGFSLFSSVSSTFWGLAACRFGVGLGLGAAPAALSLYAEFLPTAARGAGIMSFFMFFSIGAVLQSGLAWATLSNLPPEIGWRVMTAVSSLPCCVLFVLAVCGIVPESPRFLLSKGRANEALSVLQQAAITNDIKDWKLGVEDISDLDSERDSASKSSSQWRMLCSNGPVLRSLVILSFTFVIMAGLYYVLMLLTNIVIVAAATGRTETIFGCITMTATDFLLAMLVNSAEIPGLLIARRLIDRIGRRLTVSRMFAACSVCTALLWVSLTFGGGSSAANALSVFLLFLARAAALGFNQSLWVLSCEAFPTPIRGVGLGVATSFARVGGALAPTLCAAFQNDLSGALLLCTAFAVTGATVIVWFPHETASSDLDGKHPSHDTEEALDLLASTED